MLSGVLVQEDKRHIAITETENSCFFILVHLKSKSFNYFCYDTPPAGGWLRQELPVSLRRIASC